MSNTFTRDPQPRIQYSGDGSRTTFGFPFPVLASDDLLVFLDDLPATGFAIAGLNDPAGGEIDFAVPPAAGTTVTLLRRTEGIRETEFVDGGPFRAAAINAELDRIMLLIQENREEHNRALRVGPAEAGDDFCLPSTGARANRMLGFDSAGRPMAFGTSELPASGDASGLLVTPSGGSTGRALGEHLAALVNVRDHGALGDGVSDDHSAFEAAIATAQARGAPVYVPASATAYVLGGPLVLDGVALVGEGRGSTLRLGLSSGVALQLQGSGARLNDLRLLGPGANGVPADPAAVDLNGVNLNAVLIANGADAAEVRGVEVMGCDTAMAIEGGVAAVTDCRFAFNRTGVALRSGSDGAICATRTRIHACTTGLVAESAASFGSCALRGGAFSACGRALALEGAGSDWRGVDVADVTFADNLDVDLEAGPRQSIGLRDCQLDDSGKRRGVAVDLQASGETVDAPTLLVENTYAATTDVVVLELSGGSNLDLLTKGDLIVLSDDPDDIDDHWTSLKATRGGVVQKVISQTTTTATIKLASAPILPRAQAGDTIRVVGRSGTANVDSVGTGFAGDFVWLRADDHCRVSAAHNPMPRDQIELGGVNSDLRYWPGLGGEAVEISAVELERGALNGALTRLYTFEIAQNSAVSFTPPAPIGMLQAFPLSLALGDPVGAVISYRADPLGYTELLATGTTTPSNDVEVSQLTALTGTTGTAGKFTYAAHSDGKIYIENRRAGPAHAIAVYVVGAAA